MADIDFVSDLADGTATDNGVVSAHANDIDPNRGAPVEAGVPDTNIPTKVPSEVKNNQGNLRDQISSALKGEDTTPSVAQQDGGPARGEDGRFLPKNPVVDPNTQTVETAATVQVPPGLAPQDAELFAKLPAEMQASLARTMEDINEKSTRLAGYENLERLIAPRREAWLLNGMTEQQAVGQLFALSDYAGRDPVGFTKYFAEQNGVDLEELAFGSDPVDPQYAELQNEINNLKQQLGGMTTQQQQNAHNAVVNEIVEFGNATDANGTPVRPYFHELGTGIMPFVQAVKQQNPNWSNSQVLQQAYESACWGNPSIRAKMQQAANTASEAERLRASQEAAKKARAAGASIPSGQPVEASAATSSAKDLRSSIRAAMAAAN